jgi:hypothetical protein
VAGPGFEPGHHDFQSFSEALRYAVNPHTYADFCPYSTVTYHLVLSLLQEDPITTWILGDASSWSRST